LPQPLERRQDILQDLSDSERVPATRISDRVVQMEDVDPTRRSLDKLPSSDVATASAIRPNSALGSRTFVQIRG
jgi:hypothetical protein